MENSVQFVRKLRASLAIFFEKNLNFILKIKDIDIYICIEMKRRALNDT